MSNAGEAPTGQDPIDRKDLLLEQFNKIEAEPKSEPVQNTEPAPKADGYDASKDRFSPEYGKPGGRARDETGKFISKQSGGAETELQTQTLEAVKPEPWQSAPKSWKKDVAQGWGSLPPEYQRYVHEREAQMHAGIEPLLPKAELADKITEVAKPYMQTLQGLGVDLPRAVGALMRVDHGLRTLPYDQKLQLLQQTALSYGVDLSGQLQTAQQTMDPAFQNTQNELVQLKGQFSSFMQQQEAQKAQTAQEEIQRFAKDREHFDEVKPVMAKLLQSGIASGLEDAYEQAVRLTPEIFDQVQSARQAATDAEKRKAADDAAKRAKSAAVSVKSATPGSKTPTKAQDRRTMLLEQFDGLNERL